MAKPATPTRLGTKARTLWTSITTTYDLRADELRILEDACREVDLIERLEKEMGKQPLTVKGSMGQTVAHPLVQEIRQHRGTVKSLLGALDLPEDDGDSKPASRSTSARAAAEARWRRVGA